MTSGTRQIAFARVAATRYAGVAPPLRFSSFAHVYRGVRPHRGHMREFLQAGCELLGYSREELCRMHVFDIVAPEDLPKIRAQRDALLAAPARRRRCGEPSR